MAKYDLDELYHWARRNGFAAEADKAASAASGGKTHLPSKALQEAFRAAKAAQSQQQAAKKSAKRVVTMPSRQTLNAFLRGADMPPAWSADWVRLMIKAGLTMDELNELAQARTRKIIADFAAARAEVEGS